jgi:ABC-type antimicrobial peptide transport system permease subunit
VLGEVFQRGLAPVVLGTIVGVLAAVAFGRVLAGVLFGVEPTDPTSIATASGLLLLVGAIATLAPALRAGRTNPASALRSE